MDRLWFPTLAFGLLMLSLWRYEHAFTPYYRPEYDWLFLIAGYYGVMLGLFALLARRMSYVRPFDRYLLITTPFFRFKTSYKRLRGVRTTDFYRVFDLENLGWAQERYLEPLMGATVVVLRLSKYPLSERVIGMFFRNYLLAPGGSELVLVVPDWMSLSVELDSRYNEYRETQRARRSRTGFQRGIYH